MPLTNTPLKKARTSGPSLPLLSLVLLALVVPLTLMAGAGLLYWQVFRDDVLEALLRRQADMQYAYEDRLASMRAQVDKVVSRQLLDQGAIEGRVHDLLSRQAQLESRAAMITVLAEQTGLTQDATSTIAKAPVPGPDKPAVAPRTGPIFTGASDLLRKQAPPFGASAFAEPPQDEPPQIQTRPQPRPETIEKPRPEGPLELRSDLSDPDRPPRAALPNQDIPAPIRLGALARGLERIEKDQVMAVERIGAAARRKAVRLKAVIMEAGLSPDTLSPPAGKAMGGPFIPMKADPNGSRFEQELGRIAADYQTADRLSHVLYALPLRRPLAGRQDITSGYGVRMDPFLGRMALHAGLDLREETGAPVRATAGGKVVSAGWSGGYGNMVEIEHVNDLSTRYGHLSSISVSEGQSIAPGAILGRVGSTGRSTGPHLHYEVRIDGEAVDPARFLRASDRAAGLN